MRFITFMQRVKRIESESLEGESRGGLIEFAIRRCRFRIQKLSRLISLAHDAPNLKVAQKKKALWVRRSERVKRSLERFEKLKVRSNSAWVGLHELEQHPLILMWLNFEH